MDDLIAFLRARLDNEAELARATMSRANPREGVWTFADMQIRDDAGHLVVRHTWPNEGEHIARHDPARTLREVEAKRRTLARHPGATVADECPGCGAYLDGTWKTPPGALCPELADLALPYADHPAYREEWRP